MPVTVTSKWQRVSYLLTISGMTGKVELLRWTFATGLVTAGPSVAFDSGLLDLLSARLAKVVEGIPTDVQPDQVNVLPVLVNVRDASGVLVVSENVQDAFHALEIGDADPAATYYVLFSVPTGVEAPVC